MNLASQDKDTPFKNAKCIVVNLTFDGSISATDRERESVERTKTLDKKPFG